MRKRIYTSKEERAARIKANFAMYEGIKTALADHDKLDSEFKDAVSSEFKDAVSKEERANAYRDLLNGCAESDRLNAENDKK